MQDQPGEAFLSPWITAGTGGVDDLDGAHTIRLAWQSTRTAMERCILPTARAAHGAPRTRVQPGTTSMQPAHSASPWIPPTRTSSMLALLTQPACSRA